MTNPKELTMKSLEEQIIAAVTQGVGQAINWRIQSPYGESPLNKLIDQVVIERLPKIRSLIEEVVDGAITADFRNEIKDACTHKLARVLVSKMEGEFEKRATELRGSPEFRAKVTLAIDNVIKEITSPSKG